MLGKSRVRSEPAVHAALPLAAVALAAAAVAAVAVAQPATVGQ